jgi:aminopeptidase N
MRNKLTYPLLLALSVFGLTARAQQPDAKIDIQHYTFAININDSNNVIKGRATVTARFLKSADEFSLDLLKKNASGKGMLVTAIKEGKRPVTFRQDSARLTISTSARAKSLHTYVITYKGNRQTAYQGNDIWRGRFCCG